MSTGIAGAITVFALGDMIVYNRRKRRDYFAEQTALHRSRLAEAKEAAARGAADDDQLLLINRERAAFEAEKARLEKKGVFTRTKDWLFSGLKKDEESVGGGALHVLGEEGLRKMGAEAQGAPNPARESAHLPAMAEKTTHVAEGQDGRPLLGRSYDPQSESQVLKAVDAKRRDGEQAMESQATGGRSPGETENTAPPSAPSRGGWTSWMTGR